MMIKYRRDKAPGITVPNDLIARLEKAVEGVEDKKERSRLIQAEGVKIAAEEIHEVMAIPGVHGVHIMAVAWEEIVPVVVKAAGLDKERPKYLP